MYVQTNNVDNINIQAIAGNGELIVPPKNGFSHDI